MVQVPLPVFGGNVNLPIQLLPAAITTSWLSAGGAALQAVIIS
jgi:hypothetical protein